MPFFDIATSKSGPKLVCFVHFDFDMCFSLQRRAVFGHRNFKKWSEADALCTFWLWNSRYSGVQFFHIPSSKSGPRMVCFAHFDLKLTWKCASRHSGVQFSVSLLNRYLRTRRFSEPTFRPSRPTNHWKNTVIRDFPNISRVWIFFLLTFAQLYLLSSDSTSLLCFWSSDSASLLCFFNCPYCRKLDF